LPIKELNIPLLRGGCEADGVDVFCPLPLATQVLLKRKIKFVQGSALHNVGFLMGELFKKMKPLRPSVGAKEKKMAENEEPAEIPEEEKKSRVVGPFGATCMVLFCLALLFLGPGFLLTTTYFAMTFVVLKLIAKIKKVRIIEILENNNWVFFSVVGMFILSAIMAHLNPLVPATRGAALLEGIKSFFGFQSNIKLHDSMLWSMINRLFFGKAFTRGWTNAEFSYFWWSIPAFIVSFWDETVGFFGKLFAHLGKGEGLANFALKDGLMELFWGALFRRKK